MNSQDSLGMVLVTGGSRGIGAETVRLLAGAGYDVCFTYATRADAAEAVAGEVRVQGRQAACVQADVGDPGAAEDVLRRIPKHLPPLVGLVNNAGITGPLGPFKDVSVQTMKSVLDVNVLGTMLFCQAVVRQWLAQGRKGSIVNVSSIAAVTGSPGEYVHYAGSKAAVEAFTVGLARELGPAGIRVNCVSPGTALTEIHAAAGEPNRPQRVAERIPMRRPAEAREIAEAVVWLLSGRASYVTGSVLKVAGGL